MMHLALLISHCKKIRTHSLFLAHHSSLCTRPHVGSKEIPHSFYRRFDVDRTDLCNSFFT
jgi:hypothetical protein